VDITDIGAVPAAPNTAPKTSDQPETPPPAPTPEEAQPQPEPAPTPPEPAPTPEPKPAPKPTPAPKPAPEKPAPAKPTTAKSSPVKLNPTKPAPPTPAGKSRLGKDFLGRVLGDAKPSAAAVSPQALASLAQAIAAQVRPCWIIPTGPGTELLNTTLRIQFSRNGTVAGTPEVVEQTGVNDANRVYLRQHAEAARRAALRCSPLKLPPELYDQWKDIAFDFNNKLAN